MMRAAVVLVALGIASVAAVAWQYAREGREARARVDALRRAREASMRVGPEALYGHWVWTRVLEGARVVRTISADEMTLRTRDEGWSDCPRGVVCTAKGIRTLAVDRAGRMHWVANVRTSSDFEYAATVRWRAPGLAEARVRREFSCAHPELRRDVDRAVPLRFHREGDELFVRIDDPDALLPFAADGAREMVLRRIDAGEYLRRFLVRLCQPTPGAACDPACFTRPVDPW